MKCKYLYDGECNLGRECPYPNGTENSCPNFEEDKNIRDEDIHPRHPDDK